VLGSRSFTQALQVLTLVVETAGVLAIFPRLRVWIGLALLAFYGGVLLTFDYGFQLNAILTALYLLPFERGLNGRAARRLGHAAAQQNIGPARDLPQQPGKGV
jgi:hypothetical protein